jgi:hypothetical protein
MGGGGGWCVGNIDVASSVLNKLICTVRQDKARFKKRRNVLINKPLTHLEKWIKGFVRSVSCPWLLNLGISTGIRCEPPLA